LLVLLALAVALAGLGWRTYQRLQNHLPATGEYGASWASRHDLRDLALRTGSDLTGRIVLGRTRWRQTIASPLRHSLLLFGPTLSGKTLSFVIPTVLRWRGPVIATSSKVDLLLATIKRRQRRGQVYLLDPFRASGLGEHPLVAPGRLQELGRRPGHGLLAHPGRLGLPHHPERRVLGDPGQEPPRPPLVRGRQQTGRHDAHCGRLGQ
jgi:hypothetical protein